MLYLDIGNSFIKIASCADDFSGTGADAIRLTHPGDADDRWTVHLRAPHDRISEVFELVDSELVRNEPIIGCSVVSRLTLQFSERLSRRLHMVTRTDFPDGSIHYDTPDTLGIDRVLACFGAHKRSGDSDVIVIDAGTATTVDLMTQKGVFEGGVIMPGIRLMEKGLHQYAPELPVVERTLPSDWPPRSTRQAVQWGITGSYLHMIQAHVRRFTEAYPDATIWITGGDASVLTQIRTLKLQFHPNLVFEGLRHWRLSQSDN